MAFPWLAVAAVANIGSSLMGAAATRRAGEEAEALGHLNAGYIMAETGEEGRRLEFEQGRVKGTAKLGIAASGFRSGKDSMGSSRSAYLRTLQEVQSAELNWLYKSGKSRADLARKGGQAVGKELKASTYGMYGSAIGSAANLAHNWGQPGYGG